jgi:hypothetical protein
MSIASRRIRRWGAALALLPLGLGQSVAGDKTWDNGSTDGLWNTSSLNWTGAAWSNAGDAAIFGGLGQGTITLPGAINVRSFNVTSGNYTLSGAGGLTIVETGTGTAAPSSILVGLGNSLTINTPLTSSIGLYKDGAGTLGLGGPVSFPLPGTTPILGDAVNLQIGLTNSGLGGFPIGGAGTVELLAPNVLPTNTSVAIGNGWLNIGANNLTLGRLVYMNTVASGTYGPNGNNGVYGTGTLKVTGPIISQYNLGQFGISNTLGADLDMNGGTQQFLLNTIQTQLGYTALHVTGELSNGSLFKGWTGPQPGGIGLYANNTYTGATTINGPLQGGFFGGGASGNVVAGTNASSSLTVVSGFLGLFGANGSFGSATTVDLIGGSTLLLDNNASTNGTSAPAVASGNNTNRLRNDAAVTLSGSTLQLTSSPIGASSETIGTLHSANGFNVVRATATSGGTAAWDVAGAWTQGASATTQFAGTTLGTTSTIKFGSTPAMTGGIIDRAIGSNTAPSETGFVKYDATNGVVLLAPADYQTAFGSGGNVTIAANPAAPIATQTINALRSTGTATVSFDSGATLNVTSGQILSTSGTLTFDATTPNGTLAFGATPATLHAVGTITVNSPMTGTAGIIKSGNSTLNINAGASLAGMSGTLTHNSGTTTLNVPYADDINIVSGTFNLRSNLTAAGQTMTLGNPLTPSNTVGFSAGLNLQSNTVTTIAHDLVVSNGTNPNLSSFTASISQLGGATGIVQEFTGSVTLNGALNILGGGNTTNVLLFSGPISGPGAFRVQNGNIRFTNTGTNYDGPFILGNGGNTTLINFDGVNASSTGTMTIGFGTGIVTSTRVRVNAPNAIPGGQITMLGGTLELKNSMTLPNNIAISAGSPTTASVDTPAGVTASLAGTLTSTDVGNTFLKAGAGVLNVSTTTTATYTANTTVGGGTLRMLGTASLAGSPTITVGTSAVAGPTLDVSGLTGGDSFASDFGGAFSLRSGQTLKGFGVVVGETALEPGSTIAPGGSIGTLTFDSSVAFGGAYQVEIAATGTQLADLILLTGGNAIIEAGATLVFPGSNTYDLSTPLTILSVEGGGTVSGTFTATPPAGYFLTYTSNSVMLTAVPEPSTIFLLAATGLAGLAPVIRKRWIARKQSL